MFIIQCNLHQQWDSCETDLLGVTHWQASQGYTGLNWADKYHGLCSLALQHCCIHHPECGLTTSSGVPPACLILEIHLVPKVQLKSSERFPPSVRLDLYSGTLYSGPATNTNVAEDYQRHSNQAKRRERRDTFIFKMITDVLYEHHCLNNQCSRVTS